MSPKKHSSAGLIASTIFTLLLIGLGLWVFFNKQFVVDQLQVWNYKATPAVAEIEAKLDLADKGTFYFQTTHPEVNTAAEFNKNCPQQEIGNPVLGCYSKDQRIFIFDVTNTDLSGIKEVTAAHEMLHSAYSRLDVSEKARLKTLLEAEYQKNTDTDFHERMSYYERTEPGEFDNELHSIIGTEMKSISPELETYYKQYFNDRSKITAFHDNYDTFFKEKTNQSDTLYKELNDLSVKITADNAQYEADIKVLSADIANFNARAQSNSFSSVNDFNRERSALVTRSNAMDARRIALNADIATYNTKYDQYQALALQIQKLNSSLNSMSSLSDVPALD